MSKDVEQLDKLGDVFTITCCGKCPLYIEDDRGDYCAHPHVTFGTPSNPFAKQRKDGLWVAPERVDSKKLPERCPLKSRTLILRVPT